MKTEDYYQLLGVSRFATPDALRRAYHARILEVHPDRNPSDSVASDRTRRIIEAYRVLGDPQAKMRYDLAVSEPVDLPPPAPLRVRYQTPEWLLRAVTALAVFAVFVFVVMSSIQALMGDRGPVFRPDVSLLRDTHETASMPVLIQPDISDPAVWYAASRYRSSTTDGWFRHEMVRACSAAAERATRARDFTRAAFYADCVRQAENGRSATATFNLPTL